MFVSKLVTECRREWDWGTAVMPPPSMQKARKEPRPPEYLTASAKHKCLVMCLWDNHATITMDRAEPQMSLYSQDMKTPRMLGTAAP